jgi:hypothetical protein
MGCRKWSFKGSFKCSLPGEKSFRLAATLESTSKRCNKVEWLVICTTSHQWQWEWWLLSQVLTDDGHWIKPVAVASCNVFFLMSLSIFQGCNSWSSWHRGIPPTQKQSLMYQKANHSLYGGGGVYGKSTCGR